MTPDDGWAPLLCGYCLTSNQNAMTPGVWAEGDGPPEKLGFGPEAIIQAYEQGRTLRVFGGGTLPVAAVTLWHGTAVCARHLETERLRRP